MQDHADAQVPEYKRGLVTIIPYAQRQVDVAGRKLVVFWYI